MPDSKNEQTLKVLTSALALLDIHAVEAFSKVKEYFEDKSDSDPSSTEFKEQLDNMVKAGALFESDIVRTVAFMEAVLPKKAIKQWQKFFEDVGDKNYAPEIVNAESSEGPKKPKLRVGFQTGRKSRQHPILRGREA